MTDDTTYILVCRECSPDLDQPIPLESAEDRGSWAGGHTRGTGHESWVSLDVPQPRQLGENEEGTSTTNHRIAGDLVERSHHAVTRHRVEQHTDSHLIVVTHDDHRLVPDDLDTLWGHRLLCWYCDHATISTFDASDIAALVAVPTEIWTPAVSDERGVDG